MIAEHLTEQEIELYRRRKVSPGDRRIIAAHLAVCEACLKRGVNSENAVLAFNALTEAFLPSVDEKPFHLSQAELKRFIAGAAAKADQIICESHIDICGQCSEELRLLTAAVLADTSEAKRRSLRWQFGRSWQAWGSFTPARVAVAIALFGFVVLAIVFWRQRSSVSTRDESVRNGSQVTPVAAPSNQATPKLDEAENSTRPIVAGLKDNDREIRLDQEGKLTGLEGFDESSQRLVKAALAGESLARPKVLDELSSPPIALLGESPSEIAFQLISPLGRVITEQRPDLRWQALNGATSYVVSVFDGNFNRVAQSPPLSKPVWTLRVPLLRGHIYSWEVTAVKEGKEITTPAAPAPRAQFKVLEAEKLNTLKKLKGQKPESHLALGLTYARFGLVSDAEREFRQLVKGNPDSALAKKLQRTVQSWGK